jgi:predicted Ser/Thr protein kinase
VSTLEGARIAGYTIETVAGRGGMGVVYRARDGDLDRIVALKVIAPDLARDDAFRTRFVREARITAQLDHPNVIPVYDAGEDDSRLYIAMRWVEGTDLGRMIFERGPVEPRLAAELVAQAASALDAAHAHGLVHRDVKPANLLLPSAARSHVYLTDFGLAKRDGSTGNVTTTGHWMGTPDYAAPEQIEGLELDGRADVYALGCVLFAALTGRPPFADIPRLRKGWAQVNEPPPTLRSIEPGVPPALEAVVARALEKDPERRYGSAGQLGEAAVAAVASGSQRRTGPTRRLGRRSPQPAARSPQGLTATARLLRPRRSAGYALAGVLAVAAVAVAVAAAVGAFWDGKGTVPTTPAPRSPLPALPTQTVRCSETTCTQTGHQVQPPIEDGNCGTGTSAGSWARIDAGAPVLLACVASASPPGGRVVALPMPDLASARLDRAEKYLDRLGVGHDTSGGGAFGIVIRENWQVCTATPPAGTSLAPDDRVKLFVDRSC